MNGRPPFLRLIHLGSERDRVLDEIRELGGTSGIAELKSVTLPELRLIRNWLSSGCPRATSHGGRQPALTRGVDRLR